MNNPVREPSPYVPHFSDERDVDAFVVMLDRFERGEIAEPEWRAFRLVNGTYGQRQGGTLSMLRAKVPQGVASALQLEAIADVADRFSRGFCHVTTRQNVQLHFIELHSMGSAMRALARAGITTKEACGNSVRNVTAPATSGVAADEAFDTEPYAEALTRFFLRHPLSATLPRKFKIAFAGGGADHSFAHVNDLGWHARIDGAGRRGFRVTVAGGTATMCSTGNALFEFLPAGDVFAVALAVLRVFDRLGDRVNRHKNRMKFLVKTLGWDAFRAVVLEELGRVEAEGAPELPFDPDAPPVARETPPPMTPTRALPLADGEARWRATNTRTQKQPGYVAVTITVPIGDITSDQLRAVARLSRQDSSGSVRLTASQNLILRFVRVERVSAVYAALSVMGLARPDADSIADVASCPGADSCKLAVTQSRGLGNLLGEHFAARPAWVDRAPGLSIRVSGCPNGCSLHHVAGIGFQGGMRKVGGRPVPQYFVYAGGDVAGDRAHFGRLVAKVPARRGAAVVERLIELYERQRIEGETITSFLRRATVPELKAALADLEPLREADATAEDFVDLGEVTAFAPETTEGECAV